jgi:hypothetical protein
MDSRPVLRRESQCENPNVFRNKRRNKAPYSVTKRTEWRSLKYDSFKTKLYLH